MQERESEGKTAMTSEGARDCGQGRQKGDSWEKQCWHWERFACSQAKEKLKWPTAVITGIGVEITKVRAAILQRWDWYGLTPRTTPSGPRQSEPWDPPELNRLRKYPTALQVRTRKESLTRERG